MRSILTFLLFLTLTACAPPTPSGPQDRIMQAEKVLVAGQKIIITVSTAADQLCTEGVLTQPQCDKIALAYQQAHAAYVLAVDAVMVAKDGKPASWAAFLNKEALFLLQADALMQLQKGEVKP